MKEQNSDCYRRKEVIAFLEKKKELLKTGECENIERVLYDRVKRVLELRDLMKITTTNFKRAKKVINKYVKPMKKESDVRRLLKKQEDEIIMIENRYMVSMVDLIKIVMKALGEEILSNNLASLELLYEFEVEEFVFVKGIIKALKYNHSFNQKCDEVIRALDFAISEYINCIENDIDYRKLFNKSFMFVSFPESKEQEEKDGENNSDS